MRKQRHRNRRREGNRGRGRESGCDAWKTTMRRQNSTLNDTTAPAVSSPISAFGVSVFGFRPLVRKKFGFALAGPPTPLYTEPENTLSPMPPKGSPP